MKKIVQIVCPPAFTTGGPEALHQLVHAAREQDIDARLVYLPNKNMLKIDTPETYKIYNIQVDQQLIDKKGYLIVVPERDTWRLRGIKKAAKAIWWLSVDNFYISVEREKRKVFKNFFGINKPFNFEKPDLDVLHFAQSEYARDYLVGKGMQKIHMLTDYLRDDFIERASQYSNFPRHNRVAFNPLKGYETTKKIIEACPDIEFVRLENMSSSQVIDTLRSSAVYMDFGNHPGRDRIPREAAMCGCILLTGIRGSANNSIDVPIHQDYKFDESSPDFMFCISRMLRKTLVEAEKHSSNFETYRRTIQAQKSVFFNEVQTAFCE
jgi:hypothetical protein